MKLKKAPAADSKSKTITAVTWRDAAIRPRLLRTSFSSQTSLLLLLWWWGGWGWRYRTSVIRVLLSVFILHLLRFDLSGSFSFGRTDDKLSRRQAAATGAPQVMRTEIRIL